MRPSRRTRTSARSRAGSPSIEAPDAHPDESGLADRGVDDALGSELRQQPLGHLVGAVELARLPRRGRRHWDPLVSSSARAWRMASRYWSDGHCLIEEEPAFGFSLARVVGLPIDVLLEVGDGREGARLGEFGRGLGLGAGLGVDLLDLRRVEDRSRPAAGSGRPGSGPSSCGIPQSRPWRGRCCPGRPPNGPGSGRCGSRPRPGLLFSRASSRCFAMKARTS